VVPLVSLWGTLGTHAGNLGTNVFLSDFGGTPDEVFLLSLLLSLFLPVPAGTHDTLLKSLLPV
jgi:hypothetical protein